MATIIDSLLISIGIDSSKAKEGFQSLQAGAQQVDAEFNRLSNRWAGVIQGLISTVIAPVAGAFAIGKVVNSYMSDISNVASMTGAYSQKLEEWRVKRAMLQRVTKEDIELYKNGREAVVGFNIAMADLSAKLMRSFMPVMKTLVEGLNKFTAWINRNQDNIVRFLTVTAGVITTVFLPALVKMGAAMLANPLTWIVGALGALVLVIDDLVTYIQGGQTAMSGLWSVFGSGEEILAALNKAFDVLQAVLAVLWKPLAAVASAFAAFKIGSVIIQGVTTAITALRTAMAALAANPLIVALTLIISLFTWIIDVLHRVNGDWSQVWGVMKQDTLDFLNLFGGLGDKLAAFFADFIAPLDALVSIVGNVCATVWQAFKLLWSYLTGGSTEAKDAIAAAFWDALGGIGQGVLDLVSSVVAGVLSLVNKLGTALLSIGQGILTLISTLFNGAINLVASFFSFLGSALGQLGEWLLGSTSKALSSVSSAVGNTVTQILRAITGALSSAFNAVFTLVSHITGAIADAFIALGQTLQGWWQALAQGISDLISGAITFITGLISAISTTIRSALSAVVSTVQGLISTITSTAQSLVTTVGNGISAAYNAIVSTISNIVNGALSLVQSLISTISGAVQSVLAAIVGFISDRVQAALNALQSLGELITKVFSLVQAGVSNALQALSDLVNRALMAVRSAVQGLSDFISSIISTVAQGITQAFAFLSNWFTRIATTVRATMSAAIALVQGLWNRLLALVQGGVSSLSALLRNIGATLSSLWQGLASRVSGFFSQAVTTITSLLGRIPALVSSIFSSVKSLISDAFSQALTAAQEFFSAVFSFLMAIPAKLAAAFDIGGMIDKATAGLKGKLSNAWDGVTNFFGLGDKDKAGDQSKAKANAANGANNSSGASGGALSGAVSGSSYQSLTASPFVQTIQALGQNAPVLTNPPVTANHTNMVTNNNYASRHNEQRNANVVNNTITINTTADPRDIARAVGRELPRDSGNNYVSAAEGANWSMT